MTSPDHKTGTDRCAEVAKQLNENIVINVQGDEPFIDVIAVRQLIELLHRNKHIKIVTLRSQLIDMEMISDRNTVKVVSNRKGKALYFSRSVIPYSSNANHYKHIGVYGFKRRTLLELSQLSPSSLELAESLEQLRWLENGYDIHTITTHMTGNSIDTPEDLVRAEKILAEKINP